MKATFSTLSKYEILPNNLRVTSNSNPIYNVEDQY